MEISHETLLSLGFVELPNHRQRYDYHGFTGRLNQDRSFMFHGLPPFYRLAELQFIMKMIDHVPDSEPSPFVNNLN